MSHVERPRGHHQEGKMAVQWRRDSGFGERVLLDGQHRLEAIVRSETALQTVLVTNLPDEVFTTIDTGRDQEDLVMSSESLEKISPTIFRRHVTE